MVKLTIFAVISPGTIQTILNYFLLELGDESYTLTYPLMYVLLRKTLHSVTLKWLQFSKSFLFHSITQVTVQLEDTIWLYDRIEFICRHNGYNRL